MASNRANCKVTNLSITRDGNTMKASWKKPSNWSTNWDWTDVEFCIDRNGVTPVSTDVWRTPTSSQKPITYTNADRFWFRGDSWDGTDQDKAYDRSRYHPVSPGKTCSEAWVGVHGGWFPSGGIQRGNKAWAKYKFELPRSPSKKIEFNNQTGVFTVTVKTDEGKDQYERYDTVIKVSLRQTNGTEISLMGWTTTKSTEWVKTFNCAKYLIGMQEGKYITLRVWAYARGMAGDNPSAEKATATEYSVVWPYAPKIKSISLTGGMTSSGRIRVDVETGGWWKEIKLQRRVGETGTFTNVSGAEGNQDIPAYFDNYGDIFPDKGVYVYYRTMCTRENYTSYGNIVKATCIYTALPKITASATVKAPTLSAYGDRTSVKVIMPWIDDDPNTGCELMYSDQSYFGNTTTQQYTGKDSSSAVSGCNTKTVRVYGFSPGKRYYFKFRRYRNYSGDTYYSSWSSSASILIPETTTDNCGIKSPVSNADGNAATFIVVANLKNSLDNVGIEITYSTSSNAWTSSSETPQSHTYNNVSLTNVTNADWKKAWKKQVSLTLTGLTVGAKYYMKARVFGTFNGQTVYSAYSALATMTMQSAEDDKCSIAVASLSGGTRAKLTITVTENSNNTGTEIQWSSYENAWYSNDTPNSIKADWPLSSKRQTVYLTGLLPNTTYYVRARRYNDKGGNPGRWSSVVEFTTIRDTAENDSVGIVSAVPHPSGTGAEVIIGWTEDNKNLATELTWSDNPSAWTSNVSPSSMEITWDEDKPKKSNEWQHTHTVQLCDLNLGTTYYLKARRKNEDDSGTTYTSYSPMATVVMPTKSENIDVRCGIVLLESQSDGTSAKIIVGWEGDHAGCEVTWSDDPNAWESSSPPSSFEFDWVDSEPYPGYYENADGIEFDESITFYSRTGSGTEQDPYVYTEIIDASADGMYTYFLTSDAEVNPVKTYYTRTGSGTSADPYVYTIVLDPQDEDLGGYYERVCNYWILLDSWANTSTCYIKGLKQGVLYYVRARSYGGDSNKTYSEYTEDRTVMPFAYPDSVVLTVPSYVIRGNSIECWWDVASEMPPSEWHMHLAGYPNFSIAEGTGSLTHTILSPEQYGEDDTVSLYIEAGCGGGLTASGIVTVSIIDIPLCEAYGPDKITEQPVTEFKLYTDNPNSIVHATCYAFGCTLEAPDGERDQLYGDSIWTSSITPSWTETYWSETDEYSDIYNAYEDASDDYDIAKAAFDLTEEAQVLAELTEDDPEYSEAYDAAYSTQEGIALLNATGVLNDAFDSYVEHSLFDLTKDISIIDGKTYYTRSGSGTVNDPYIYTEVAQPVAIELFHYYDEEKIYVFEPEMPIVDLYDGGQYWCEFSILEKIAGVSSKVSSVDFAVEYDHQAPNISNCVVISPQYDTRSAIIKLSPPTGSVYTDVYDIYRMSPTGFDLIRQGLDLDSEFEDYYAPFGHDELVYRVAIRTADGDFSWLDFSYIMPVYILRFDWNNNFAEYPWNIEAQESMAKSFESRVHVDGSINGYWDVAVEHKGSFSTDVIRVESWDLIKAARDIGKYPGPIFVRDSYGKAMTCNVEVKEISIPNLSNVVGLSFEFTHIKITEQFLPENGSGGLPATGGNND